MIVDITSIVSWSSQDSLLNGLSNGWIGLITLTAILAWVGLK